MGPHLTPILAHGAGAGGLPVAGWLAAYLQAFAAFLVVAGLRASSPRARWSGSGPGDGRGETTPAPTHPSPLGSALGLAAYAALFLMAAGSIDADGSLASTLVVSVLGIGGVLVAVVAGDWFAPVDPFPLLLGAVRRSDDDDTAPAGPGPAWTAALLLGLFHWFWLVYAVAHAPTSGETAIFLLLYAGLAVAGAARWGRAWLAHGEGIAATMALAGACSPLRGHPGRRLLAAGRPGTAALVAVLAGVVGYGELARTDRWGETLGAVSDSQTARALAVGTLGLVACVAVPYLVLRGAATLAARLAGRPAPDLADRLAAACAPVVLGGFLAHLLLQLTLDVQNAWALASDPLGRGWDLFGTIDRYPTVPSTTALARAGTALIALGTVASAVLVHEVAFGSFTPRRAARAVWPLGGVVAATGAGASLLLLGT